MLKSIKLAIVMCKGVQLIQQEHELDPELEGLIDGAIYQTERLLLKDKKRLEEALFRKYETLDL